MKSDFKLLFYGSSHLQHDANTSGRLPQTKSPLLSFLDLFLCSEDVFSRVRSSSGDSLFTENVSESIRIRVFVEISPR